MALRTHLDRADSGCPAVEGRGAFSHCQAGRPSLGSGTHHPAPGAFSLGRISAPALKSRHKAPQLGLVDCIIPNNATRDALFNPALKQRPSSRHC